MMFPFRNFTIDHVVPQSRGGTDHLDNVQLLCGACNIPQGRQVPAGVPDGAAEGDGSMRKRQNILELIIIMAVFVTAVVALAQYWWGILVIAVLAALFVFRARRQL